MIRWTPSDDEALCRAWVTSTRARTSRACGVTEGLPNDIMSWFVLESDADLTVRALQYRWSVLLTSICKFTECYRRAGGPHVHQAVDKAKQLYRALTDKEFEFVACWEILRTSPAFAELHAGARMEERARKEQELHAGSSSPVQPQQKTTTSTTMKIDTGVAMSPGKHKRAKLSPSAVESKKQHSPAPKGCDRSLDPEGIARSLHNDKRLIRQVKRLVDAADDYNALLETQMGVMLFTQPMLSDSEAAKEYFALARRYHLNRMRGLMKNQPQPQQQKKQVHAKGTATTSA